MGGVLAMLFEKALLGYRDDYDTVNADQHYPMNGQRQTLTYLGSAGQPRKLRVD